MAAPLREAFGRPVCCTLQGEELFVNGLPTRIGSGHSPSSADRSLVSIASSRSANTARASWNSSSASRPAACRSSRSASTWRATSGGPMSRPPIRTWGPARTPRTWGPAFRLRPATAEPPQRCARRRAAGPTASATSRASRPRRVFTSSPTLMLAFAAARRMFSCGLTWRAISRPRTNATWLTRSARSARPASARVPLSRGARSRRQAGVPARP